jgi:hypothetical protein
LDCFHTQIHSKEDADLEFTRGFYVHFDQISRILNFVARDETRSRFSANSLAGATGLSSDQASTQARIAAAMGLLVPRSYRPTAFGQLVADRDVFLEGLGTLWVCHYALSASPRRLVWNHLTNCLLPTEGAASLERVRATLQPLSSLWTANTWRINLRQEVTSFFNAYTEQAYRQLRYLRQTDDGTYALTDSPVPVPPGAFLAILLIYRDRFHPGASGLEVDAICTADHSPGRLLHLDELGVRTLLNRLHEAGQLAIEAKADLDQVRFRPGQTWLAAMQSYYEE